MHHQWAEVPQRASHLGCHCAVLPFQLRAPGKSNVLAGELVPFAYSHRSLHSPCLLFQDSLDAMLQWLLHMHRKEEVVRAGLCTEGALLLLEMLKATMSQVRPIPHMLRGAAEGKTKLRTVNLDFSQQLPNSTKFSRYYSEFLLEEAR